MDQLNYGAIPAFHEDKFYMVGGYGFSDSIAIGTSGIPVEVSPLADTTMTNATRSATVRPTSCMRFGGIRPRNRSSHWATPKC